MISRRLPLLYNRTVWRLLGGAALAAVLSALLYFGPGRLLRTQAITGSIPTELCEVARTWCIENNTRPERDAFIPLCSSALRLGCNMSVAWPRLPRGPIGGPSDSCPSGQTRNCRHCSHLQVCSNCPCSYPEELASSGGNTLPGWTPWTPGQPVCPEGTQPRSNTSSLTLAPPCVPIPPPVPLAPGQPPAPQPGGRCTAAEYAAAYECAQGCVAELNSCRSACYAPGQSNPFCLPVCGESYTACRAGCGCGI